MEPCVVLLAGHAVALTAAQTQPRPGELALAARINRPKLRQQHVTVLIDHRLRCSFPAPQRVKTATVTMASILTVLVPLLLLSLINGLKRRVFSEDD